MSEVVQELLNYKNKKFYIFSTACLSLLDETNRIGFILNQKNKLVKSPEEADFIVVTTCAVSKDSAMNSVNNIKRFCQLKNKKVYVGGCLSNAKERENLFSFKNVYFFNANDIFSEIDKVNSICERITVRCDPFWLSDLDKKEQKLKKILTKNKKLADLYAFTTDGIIFSRMHFEFDTIRISKGCNKRCTYCAIPNNRGKYIEHDLKYVKDQIDKSKNDHILIIGENIGCHKDFEKIIEYLIKKNKKIMLRYLEPEHVNRIKDEYLGSIVYIGVPIQSGSKKILEDRHRLGNIDEVNKKFKIWNKRGIFLGTSIILSYPTEKFIDYLKTIYFIISNPINYTSFQNFSPRENSLAFEQYSSWNSNTNKIKLKFWIFDKIVFLKGKLQFLQFKIFGGRK